jgi:protein TonB
MTVAAPAPNDFDTAGLWPRENATSNEIAGPGWWAWMVTALVHATLVMIGVAAALTRVPPLPRSSDAIAVTLAFESAATESQPLATVEAPLEARPAHVLSASLEAIVPAPGAEPEVTAVTPKTAPVPPRAPRPVTKSHARTSNPLGSAEAPSALQVYHPSGPAAPATPLQSGPRPLTAPLQEAFAPIIPPHPVSGLASNRKPVYPVEARSRHETGRVVLRVHVSAAGSAAAVDIVTSSGHSLLDQAALSAILAWRFDPATRAGFAVPGQVDVPVDFRIDE